MRAEQPAAGRKNDLSMYELYAHEWWASSRSRFRSLQGISKFRLQTLQQWVPDICKKDVIDLGCGGGLLSAPLSKLGANVIGVDISQRSLAEATKQSAPSARYLCSDVRDVPLPSHSADVVIIADVLDHIPNYPRVLIEARRLIRDDGYLYINTINRNFFSKFLAVTLGENIGLVPKGTHDPSLFIKPRELEDAAQSSGFRVLDWKGERPAIWETVSTWSIHFAPSKSLLIAYSALLAPVAPGKSADRIFGELSDV